MKKQIQTFSYWLLKYIRSEEQPTRENLKERWEQDMLQKGTPPQQTEE